MLARIRVALRHVRRPEMDSDTPGLAINGIVLDTRRRAVRVRGTPVDLPRIEFELLRVLMANAGTALARDQLLQEVWGRSLGVPFQVLYVHIGCLRNRIELDPRHPQLIQTVRHVGYKFAGPAF
jgi:DNA-binding response OmpR family regulator